MSDPEKPEWPEHDEPAESPEARKARKADRLYYLSLGAVQDSITEKATQHMAGHPAYPKLPQAFIDATQKVKLELMHHASHPGEDQEAINVNTAPWPPYGDYPPDEPLTLTEALEESIGDNPDLFGEDEDGDEDDSEGEEEPPIETDPRVIPDELARYANADESADDFRRRLKSLWQRFGIDDGKHFPGGGEPLTGSEKIMMREVDMLLNSEDGRNAQLLKWLDADDI